MSLKVLKRLYKAPMAEEEYEAVIVDSNKNQEDVL